MARPAKWPPTIHKHLSGKAFIKHRGRQIYLPFQFADRDSPENRQHYLRALAELQAGPTPRRTGSTVADLVAAFLEDARNAYPPASREPAQFILSLRPLLSLYGTTQAADFGPMQFESMVRAMADGSWKLSGNIPEISRKRCPGWCRNVVNRRAVRVRTLFRWAERHQLVPPGTWATLRTVPLLSVRSHHVRHTAPVQASSLRDVVAVARHLPPSAAAMLLTQWWSGMRSCEARAMTTAAIDRSDPRCWLYTVPIDADKTSGHPDGRRRVVALGPRCIALVRRWLDLDHPDRPVFLAPCARRRRNGTLRYRTVGYSCHGYAQAVRRACARAGVKITAYAGRHATRLRVTRTEGLDAARSVLGHRSLIMTAQYAAGQDLELAKRAAKRSG